MVDPTGKYKNLSVTYADLLYLMSGYAYKAGPQKELLGDGYGEGQYRYVYVGFSDDKFHPVMSFDAQGKEQTASYVAFMKAMEW